MTTPGEGDASVTVSAPEELSPQHHTSPEPCEGAREAALRRRDLGGAFEPYPRGSKRVQPARTSRYAHPRSECLRAIFTVKSS